MTTPRKPPHTTSCVLRQFNHERHELPHVRVLYRTADEQFSFDKKSDFNGAALQGGLNAVFAGIAVGWFR